MKNHSPMHWDAENLFLGGEDLLYCLRRPVSSMLTDDNGLMDICNDSMPIALLLQNSCDGDCQGGTLEHTVTVTNPGYRL